MSQLLSIIKLKYYKVVCFSLVLMGRRNRKLEETRDCLELVEPG